MPEFLPAIPLAKLTLMLNRFEYRLMPGKTHWLSRTVVPPFADLPLVTHTISAAAVRMSTGSGCFPNSPTLTVIRL